MTTLANTYGIAARNFTAYPEMPNARALVEYGVRVEELGYDSVWVWDHMLLGVEPNFPIIDSLTLLTAIGAPPEAAALAFAVTVLAGIVPAAPGGAGTREMLLIPALVLAYGIPSSTAFAFSMAIQATALATSLAVGAIALAWLGPRLVFRRDAAPECALHPEPVLAVAAALAR